MHTLYTDTDTYADTQGGSYGRTLCASTSIVWQPETQGLPIPRATTAACEVMPPWKCPFRYWVQSSAGGRHTSTHRQTYTHP